MAVTDTDKVCLFCDERPALPGRLGCDKCDEKHIYGETRPEDVIFTQIRQLIRDQRHNHP
jgi:hypothetical protein